MKAPLKLSSALLPIAVLFIAGLSTCSAQLVSVYGTFSTIRLHSVANGNVPAGTGSISSSTSDYWANGIGGGVTFTPFHLGPLSLGLDLRGSTSRQKQGADTLLAGIKLGGKFPLIPLKPYVQASGGYLAVRSPNIAVPVFGALPDPNRSFWGYELLGGLDYTVLPHLDLRLIELGGGQGYSRSSPNINIPNINLFTINSGVVIRF